MIRTLLIAVICISIVPNNVHGQDADLMTPKVYFTNRVTQAPMIDADISDPAWEQVAWGEGFTQRSPYDGIAPTQPTAFKIVYDDHALYVAFRCYHTDPEHIESRMSRRDGFAGDLVELNIDSYNDNRSAFSFTPSVSGVKGDEFVTDDGNFWDTSWDPVWHVKTQIDSLGWIAEAVIPLSQLRFSNQDEQVWGIQVMRHDFSKESRSLWQYIPNNASYWVSGFGELRGIKGIKPKRQIEIQPYVLAQLDTYKKLPGNRFADGTDASISAGIDGKIGVTNDISLDFTVNPDFGQVEADPSVLNLDGFQIFFNEKRPFFVQNRDLFNYNISGSEAGGAYDSDNLFYSRRIGASPHRLARADDGSESYVDQPEFTSILGAAKLSGKTPKGLSIGIMEAITQRERALVQINGTEHHEAVEPITNYFVGRLRQDFNEGNTVLGGIVTLVNRDIHDPSLDFLHQNAQTGGLDLVHRWNDRTWQMNARLVFSRVAGSTTAIQRTQSNFEHGFTRPDADHLDYDPEATELIGQGGNVSVAKYGSDFKFQTGMTWRSPKLELNDVGFMRNTDEINHYYWMGYHKQDPYSIFRSTRLNYNHWARWDFGGKNLYRAVSMNFHADFMNFWNVTTGIAYENLDMTNNWLRGGPTYRRSAGMAQWISANTDERKAVSFSVEGNYGFGFDYLVRGQNIGINARVQPSDAINFSIGPSWENFERIDQYVTTINWEGNTRYITGYVNQRTLSFTLRVNYNITPDLTLQYYGQPFISRGRYSRFNYVVDPLASDKSKGLSLFHNDQISLGDNLYSVDDNKDGVTDYEFENPDFNFVQFRSNLVARWEYQPGSEIFLVWTQGNTAFGQPNEQALFDSLSDNIFGDNTRNTFLIKMTYRFLNK